MMVCTYLTATKHTNYGTPQHTTFGTALSPTHRAKTEPVLIFQHGQFLLDKVGPLSFGNWALYIVKVTF